MGKPPMPECPNCHHRWTEITCDSCHRPMKVTEGVHLRNMMVCETCAAQMVGDRRRSYEVKTGAPRGT